MRDNGGRNIDDNGGRIHWPTVADPMVLLDGLERRLDQCETTVSAHPEQIQRRLDDMETDMSALKSDISESRQEHERQVLELAERLTRLEDNRR